MKTYLDTGELVIGDHNAHLFLDDHIGPDGLVRKRGLIPRDYAAHPPGCYRSAPRAVDMPLVDQSEWAKRIADMDAQESSLSHIRLRGNAGQPIPSLDQNGKGYCWAHSSTGAVMMLRAVMGLPYVPLSAYAIACIVKSYRDEGGWGAESLDFITERGVPSAQFWPMQSMSRANDNAKTWENAALHKVTEGWVDLSAEEYDRTLSWQQEITCYLCRIPVVKDENWWSHSICGLRAVDGASARNRLRGESGKLLPLTDFDLAFGMDHPVTGGIGVEILNSWGDSWGKLGTGILTGSKAISDGAVAPRVTLASAA